MAVHWIDTNQARAQARRRRDFCALIRNYYNGRPYRDPFQPILLDREGDEDVNQSDRHTWLWRLFMAPTDDDRDIPIYIRNLLRDALDLIMLELLPDEMELVLKGADIKDLEGFLEPMMNFGDLYSENTSGCKAWVRDLGLEVAKAGDGLVVPRFRPDAKHLTWDFVQSEFFEIELDPITNDTKFCRIEFQYPLIEGDQTLPIALRTLLYREDLYNDHVERFEGAPLPASQELPPLGGRMFSQAILFYAGERPLNLTRQTSDEQAITEELEKKIYTKLGRGPAWPIVWHAENFVEKRGVSEIQLNQLRTLDFINRLLVSWADAAHNTGNPPLAGLDFTPPGEEKTSRIYAAGSGQVSGSHSKVRRQDGFAPGSSFSANTRSDKNGWFGYPHNQPTVPPYEKALDALVAAFYGVNISGTMDPQKISHVGEMSGFSNAQFRLLHRQRILKYRARLIGKVQQILNYGLKLCDAIGLIKIPAAKKDERIRLEFRFGADQLTADEELKQMVTNKVALDMGFPPDQIGQERFPFTITDWPSVEKGLLQNQKINFQSMQVAAESQGGGTDSGLVTPLAGKSARLAGKVDKAATDSGIDNNAK